MKAFAVEFSMMVVVALTAALAIGGTAMAGAGACATSPGDGPGPSADISAEAARPGGYPSFCSIPAVPTDVRSAVQFRQDVLAVRTAGAHLERDVSPETFRLEGSEAFAAAAKRQGAPPPAMATPGDEPTAAFIKAMRARATPPPRPRKH
ncbi:MAG: hypothetical protein ACYC8V_00460 [Caulobacteraceae bacterium]